MQILASIKFRCTKNHRTFQLGKSPYRSPSPAPHRTALVLTKPSGSLDSGETWCHGHFPGVPVPEVNHREGRITNFHQIYDSTMQEKRKRKGEKKEEKKKTEQKIRQQTKKQKTPQTKRKETSNLSYSLAMVKMKN